MRVLVTGCAGFIGARVCQLLMDLDHTVVGADNLNDAYDVRLKQWRLDQLQELSGFRFQVADISKQECLRDLFQLKPDAVVNLAARAGVRQSLEEPQSYLQTNVMGTLNLLDLCREYDVKKFVLASTSSLYGACHPRPFREDAETDRPLSPYAASKKAAEVMCSVYHHLYSVDVTVLRYFTVYGPAGRPDMSVFRFIRWITEGEPVVLYGDGSQERDFTYIDDIAQGTVSALRPLGYEIINLGSDRPASIQAVIQLTEELVGKKAQIDYQPLHRADMPATWAQISKAARLLDWRPRTTLQAGLKQAVAWYAENRSWAKEVSPA